MSALFPTIAGGRIRHFLTDEESSLLNFLVRRAGLDPEEAARLLFIGGVYLDRQRASSDVSLSPGRYLRVHLQPRRFPVAEVDWRAIVVEHNDQFLVVNKPVAVPVHPTVDNRVENVLYQLSMALRMPLYITQRLDTDVGGLLVLAKTKEFQREFNRLLVARKIKKTYRALVTSPPETGRHVHYMKASERSPKSVSKMDLPESLECVLRVIEVKRIQCASGSCFDATIDLETGRTHQIRAQLSAMGTPIIGDAVYGSRSPYEVNGQSRGIALFSTSTSWCFDDQNPWSFRLAPPWSLPEPSSVQGC